MNLFKYWEINAEQIKALKESGRLDRYTAITNSHFDLINGTIQINSRSPHTIIITIILPFRNYRTLFYINQNKLAENAVIYYAQKKRVTITKSIRNTTIVYKIHPADTANTFNENEVLSFMDLFIEIERLIH